MRYACWFCGTSVTSELPADTVMRAILVCPACIEAKRITFPEDEAEARRDATADETGAPLTINPPDEDTPDD